MENFEPFVIEIGPELATVIVALGFFTTIVIISYIFIKSEQS